MTTVSEDLAAIRTRFRDRIDRRVVITLAVSAAAHVAFIAWAQTAEAHRAPQGRPNFRDDDGFAAAPIVRLPPAPPPELLQPGAPTPGLNTQPGTGSVDHSTARPSMPGHRGDPAPGADPRRFLDLLGRQTISGRGVLDPTDGRRADYDRALTPGGPIQRDGWDGNRTVGEDGTNKDADRERSYYDPFVPIPPTTKEKDEVKLPPGDCCAPDPGPDPVPTDARKILTIFKQRYLGGIKACYERTSLKQDDSAGGRVEIELEISATGTVTDHDFDLGDLDSSELDSCMSSQLKSYRFGLQPESLTVRFPIVFRPGQK